MPNSRAVGKMWRESAGKASSPTHSVLREWGLMSEGEDPRNSFLYILPNAYCVPASVSSAGDTGVKKWTHCLLS